MKIENSRIQDVEMLKDNLRKHDVDEVFASSNATPELSLTIGLSISSYCKTVFVGNKPIAMFGMVPVSEIKACAWGLCSKDIAKVKKEFYKFSKKQLAEMLSLFPVIFNYVDCRNKTSIRWLKALGARFNKPELFGVAKIPFQKFYFRRKDYV